MTSTTIDRTTAGIKGRVRRGLALYRTRGVEIVPMPAGGYSVPSATREDRSYRVCVLSGRCVAAKTTGGREEPVYTSMRRRWRRLREGSVTVALPRTPGELLWLSLRGFFFAKFSPLNKHKAGRNIEFAGVSEFPGTHLVGNSRQAVRIPSTIALGEPGAK